MIHHMKVLISHVAKINLYDIYLLCLKHDQKNLRKAVGHFVVFNLYIQERKCLRHLRTNVTLNKREELRANVV